MFFQILERTDDLDGVLEEGRVEVYYDVVSRIPIRDRLLMRVNPVVGIDAAQAREITTLSNLAEAARMAGREAGHSSVIQVEYLKHLRETLCLRVCAAYFDNRPVVAVTPTRDDVVFNNFLIALYANCHTDRTVRFYADLEHLSPFYFSSIVKERSGRTASEWIEEVTMTFARQYLTNMELSVKEIADRMNFPDQSCFGRYFRRHEGCSPTDFRNSLKT